MRICSDYRTRMQLMLRLGAAVLAILLASCGAEREGQSDTDRGPLARPRMLEVGGDLAAAAREYALVAERAAGTEIGVTAVRRTAYLHAMLRNDSTALHWYRILADLPTSSRERELVRLQVSSLERILSLTAEIGGGAEDADSLRSVARHLLAANTAQGRQIRDLETQLKKVSEELRQLKEIDARPSGRKPKE